MAAAPGLPSASNGAARRTWPDGHRTAARLLQHAFDALYPPACAWCSAPLPAIHPDSPTDGIEFCAPCQAAIEAAAGGPCCRKCGSPIGPGLPDDGCAECRGAAFPFRETVRLGVYDGVLRAVCLRGKEQGGALALRHAARLLVLRRRDRLGGLGAEVVVPVPQHPWDRWRRPHNSAELIAAELARALDLDCLPWLLRKVRLTTRQHQLTSALRRNNLAGAFRASSRHELDGLSVLLVDDVMTTGTTARIATRALLESGARRVDVAVLARTARA